jgi:hypothetical protein
MMMCNVGKVDRIVRLLSAIVLIGGALYFIPAVVPKTLILIASVLLLASAWTGVCFFYKMLGWTTAKPVLVQPNK